jgi:glyoxylase-like metal-dependent hydrolase (beta-lactamase superfamily II)
MHQSDVEMSANGDMFAGRNRPSWPVRTLASLTLRLPEEDRFEPDVLVDEGCDLSEYGLAGTQVVLLCGHSAGSIALLLADGSLFCGDVLENRKTPRLGSILDDPLAAKTSVERLGTMMVGTVYPGHGSPFEFGQITAVHP